LPVDCAGQLPDGRPFKSYLELRDLLAADQAALAGAFARQLATYATGREIGFSQRAELENLLARARDKNFGVRSLLLELVASPLFAKP
jgi:hypothetical protein